MDFNDAVFLYCLPSFHRLILAWRNVRSCFLYRGSAVCIRFAGKLLVAEQETVSQAQRIETLQGYTCDLLQIL